jgi:hypothetical protein
VSRHIPFCVILVFCVNTEFASVLGHFDLRSIEAGESNLGRTVAPYRVYGATVPEEGLLFSAAK